MWWIPLFLAFGLAWADDVRMDCHPEPGASQQDCEERDCIWQPPADQQVSNVIAIHFLEVLSSAHDHPERMTSAKVLLLLPPSLLFFLFIQLSECRRLLDFV